MLDSFQTTHKGAQSLEFVVTLHSERTNDAIFYIHDCFVCICFPY